MATSDKPTNGEYYDHTLKSWMVQCGADNVPFLKLDKDGKPVPPPDIIVSSA